MRPLTDLLIAVIGAAVLLTATGVGVILALGAMAW